MTVRISVKTMTMFAVLCVLYIFQENDNECVSWFVQSYYKPYAATVILNGTEEKKSEVSVVFVCRHLKPFSIYLPVLLANHFLRIQL